MSSAPDHIYLDLAVMNNDTTGQDRRPINFSETRTNPIIDNPSNYFMSVVRFEVDTPAITVPLFIPKLLIDGVNDERDKTTYSITIGKPVGGQLTDWHQRYVTWYPEDKTARLPNNVYDSAIIPVSPLTPVEFLPLLDNLNTLPVISSTILMPTLYTSSPDSNLYVFDGEYASTVTTLTTISTDTNSVTFPVISATTTSVNFYMEFFGEQIIGLLPPSGINPATWYGNIDMAINITDSVGGQFSVTTTTITDIVVDSPLFAGMYRYRIDTGITLSEFGVAEITLVGITNNNLQCLAGGTIPLCLSSSFVGEAILEGANYSEFNMTLDKPYLDIPPVPCGSGIATAQSALYGNNNNGGQMEVGGGPNNVFGNITNWTTSVGLEYPFYPTAFDIRTTALTNQVSYAYNVVNVSILSQDMFQIQYDANPNIIKLIIDCVQATNNVPPQQDQIFKQTFADNQALLSVSAGGFTLTDVTYSDVHVELYQFNNIGKFYYRVSFTTSNANPIPPDLTVIQTFNLANGFHNLFPDPTPVTYENEPATSPSTELLLGVSTAHVANYFPFFSKLTVIAPNGSETTNSFFGITFNNAQLIGSTIVYQSSVLPQNIVLDFSPDVVAVRTQDITTGYYNCYSARWWLNCVNRTLSELWTDLGESPTSGVPQFVIDAGTNLITLMTPFNTTANGGNLNFAVSADVAPTATWEGTGSSPTIEYSMFFNQPMFNLFSSMPFIFYGRTLKDVLDPPINTELVPEGVSVLSYYVQPTNYEYKNYLTQNDNTIPTYNWFITTSEYSPVPMWNPIMSLVFTTSLLPVQLSLSNPPTVYGGNVADETFSNGGGNNSQINNQISDIEIPLTTGSEYKPQVLYYPAAEYRCIDLLGNSPINSVSFQVSYKTKFGQLIPIILGSQCGANLKILFRRKRFNLGNLEPYNTN